MSPINIVWTFTYHGEDVGVPHKRLPENLTCLWGNLMLKSWNPRRIKTALRKIHHESQHTPLLFHNSFSATRFRAWRCSGSSFPDSDGASGQKAIKFRWRVSQVTVGDKKILSNTCTLLEKYCETISSFIEALEVYAINTHLSLAGLPESCNPPHMSARVSSLCHKNQL